MPDKPKTDVESVHSAFSVFSSTEGAQSRFQVIKEGYLDVAKQTKTGSNTSFTCKFCRLTRDGRMTLEEGSKKENLVVDECTVIDATVFRLAVLNEADLSSKESVEYVFKARGEEEGTEWLISVETALRSRLQNYRNELDCARGTMEVKEVNKFTNVTFDKVKTCQCFYYNGSFRVKNLDGPQTSTFVITNVSTDEINLPMCLLLETPGRNFVCRVDDIDIFKKWLYTIRKDVRKKQGEGKKPAKSNEAVLKMEMLVGPTPEKLIRVSGRYLRVDRIFETKDFAGVIDSFYVQRVIIMPKPDKNSTSTYNMVIMACATTDEAEANSISLYANCEEADVAKWREMFSTDIIAISAVVDKAIMQVELRRIMRNESSAGRSKRIVSFHDVHYLLTMDETRLDEVFSKPDEWPVGRLERLIQIILKVPPEPLVPYALQKEFLDLGRDMATSKAYKDSHLKKALELVEKLDDMNRGIMEKMTLHIFRLTTHYNKKKAEAAKTDGKPSGPTQKLSSSSCSVGNHDLTVWTRLNKYIFRFNEQNMTDAIADTNLTFVSHVVVAFQRRYVEQLRKQADKSSSKSKKAEFESCKQQ